MSYCADVDKNVELIAELTDCVVNGWQPSPFGMALPLLTDQVSETTVALELFIDWEKTKTHHIAKLSEKRNP